jgi:hypothetical protein
MQAIPCAGVVAQQTYDLATAVEARPRALLALQRLTFAGGLIGGVGALATLARGASP